MVCSDKLTIFFGISVIFMCLVWLWTRPPVLPGWWKNLCKCNFGTQLLYEWEKNKCRILMLFNAIPAMLGLTLYMVIMRKWAT